MIEVNGKYYDGKISDVTNAKCFFYENGEVIIELENNVTLPTLKLDQIRISSRLGNTPRYIYLPGEAKFETEDNDALDQVIIDDKDYSWHRFIHMLESHKKFILLSLFILIAFVFGSIKFGVPFASKYITQILPPSAFDLVSKQTLQALDRSVLGPSETEEEKIESIMTSFRDVLESHPEYQFTILFRKGGAIGPNAFALPDGTIIFTDEMVKISENNYELLAILVHEIGHVVHRHGMRRMVQDSLLGFTLLAITGDVAGSSELLLGFPVLMTELAYSRGFEREADDYAFEWLKTHQVPTVHFARLLRRIESKREPRQKKAGKKWLDYLSTHPNTKERIRRFESNL